MEWYSSVFWMILEEMLQQFTLCVEWPHHYIVCGYKICALISLYGSLYGSGYLEWNQNFVSYVFDFWYMSQPKNMCSVYAMQRAITPSFRWTEYTLFSNIAQINGFSISLSSFSFSFSHHFGQQFCHLSFETEIPCRNQCVLSYHIYQNYCKLPKYLSCKCNDSTLNTMQAKVVNEPESITTDGATCKSELSTKKRK